jgi:C1A family cysteine protease
VSSAVIRYFLLIKKNNTIISNTTNNINRLNTNKLIGINNINNINKNNKQIKKNNINKLIKTNNINNIIKRNNINNRINAKNIINSNNIKNIIKKNNIKINTLSKKKIYNIVIKKINPGELNHKNINTDLGLPNSVDLRSKFPPVFDQGMLGSCTANALCGLVAFDDPRLIGSRLFLYYNERMMENNISNDVGALISDGIKCLLTYGLCAETEWPYDIQQFAIKPPDSCYINALMHQALEVTNIVDDPNSMKNALANNNPFAIGISIYSSFETELVANTGNVPIPTKNDQLLGGHAIVCVGYDDIKKHWIMRNSWGASWGDNGYFYLPYTYLSDRSLATDLWCINKMEL